MPDSFQNSPVLVWQMGKVGSTSIWNALNELDLKPIQLHVLNPERINRIVEEHEGRGFATPDHILDACRVQSLLRKPDEKFRIISLVRDPVARNLSALFESWDVYPPSCREEEGLAKLAEWFVMNFDYSVLDWFDNEIKAITGINIFNYSFDHKKKSLFIETDAIKMLVLRSEDSQLEKERNLKEFLRAPELQLGFSNSSNEKPYNKIWKQMKSCARISSVMSDIVYESSLVRHFYTPDEISDIRKSWTPQVDGVYFEP